MLRLHRLLINYIFIFILKKEKKKIHPLGNPNTSTAKLHHIYNNWPAKRKERKNGGTVPTQHALTSPTTWWHKTIACTTRPNECTAYSTATTTPPPSNYSRHTPPS
jgi:hypothetical protein